jgi:hypothetical protein
MDTGKVNIFEVLDNFFGSQQYPLADTLGIGKIRELREHVVDFYKTYPITKKGNFQTQLYLRHLFLLKQCPTFLLHSYLQIL